MRKFILLFILLAFFNQPHGNCQTLFFRINSDSARKNISPLIYGTNQDYNHASAKRLGGNRLTGYNWENNASNAGIDFHNESDDYEVGDQGVPDADATTPASVISYFHQKSLKMGAYSLVTLPMAGYVANDISGYVTSSELAPSARWSKVLLHKPSSLSLTPDLTDHKVYVDEELNYLINKFGKSNTPTGIKGYYLDNEPDIWYSSHPYLFGTDKLTVNYLMNNSIQTANLIKDMDPTAEVFGWASYGFSGYKTLQDAPDWPTVQGSYNTFLEYYLEKMKEEEHKTGRRILDVLDLHWYPESDLTTGVGPFDDKTDLANSKLRMDMVRSLWDSNYVENTWIGKENRDLILPLLPNLKKYIADHYPNTKLAISEYSYMGKDHVSGGIAQADALGVFGKHDVYMATYWGYVVKYLKAGFDLYKNYDGKGGSFGDVSVGASTNDDEYSSVYASIETADASKMHIIALNKDQDSSRLTTFSIGGSTIYKSAAVYMFDNTGYVIKQLNNIRKIDNNTFQLLLPPLSAYHLILTTEDLSVYPYIDSLSQNITGGYADGKTNLHIEAKISDGDNNIDAVTIDLSALGGSANQAVTLSGNKYMLDYTIPAGVGSGLKNLHFSVIDKTNHIASAELAFRVIISLPPLTLWDGDVVGGGEPYVFFEDTDPKQSQIKMDVINSGGNTAPINLHMYMIHSTDKYNQFCWRFAPDAYHVRDVSDYGFLEFYIRSNGAAKVDIDVSLQDASEAQNNSATVAIKDRGYISSFNGISYTRVRIPFSEFTEGKTFDLTKLWQINFHTNTSDKGCDVWIDDIKAVSWALPAGTPRIDSVSMTPQKGYSDGTSVINLIAKASDPDNNLKGVYADLSSLGGSNKQPLLYNGSINKFQYTIPTNLLKGIKNILVFALDNDGNEKDTTLRFNIYQKSSTDTIWNGDHINYGSAWVSNSKTTSTLINNGGNYQPGVMASHLEAGDGDDWSGIVWDWNDGTDDNNIQDLTDKRLFSFYLKVPNAPADFDLELKLKDIYANESQPIHLKADNYISSYTGSYQHIVIPLHELFDQSTINTSLVSRFVLTASTLPIKGIDVYVDDISGTGSVVASIDVVTQDASCDANGTIKINGVQGGTSNYNYYINNTVNPNGATNAIFDHLVPGSYDIKITGDRNFVFLENEIIRGSAALDAVITSSNGKDIFVTVRGGSGRYGYSWNTGATTQNLLNNTPGTYIVTITDSASSCIARKTITIGTTLPIILSSFNVKQISNDHVQLVWKTEQEFQMDYFEIERKEGGVFNVIGRINTKGNGIGTNYSFDDKIINTNSIYQYRIICHGKNGEIIYSPIRIIKISNVNAISLFPNPTNSKTTLNIDNYKGAIDLIISNSSGEIIWKEHSSSDGQFRKIIDLSKYAKGVYLLSIKMPDKSIVRQILLQ